jgi:hypothetical protein
MNNLRSTSTEAEESSERWARVRRHRCWLPLLGVLSGCVSDGTLLQENSAVALRSARFQARQDLNCPGASVNVVSEKEVSGAPWGYLYSDYRIRAEGCGGRAVYTVECRSESLCDVTREAP